MRLRSSVLCLVILVLVGLPSLGQAAPPRQRLRGRVLDEKGVGLAGVEVLASGFYRETLTASDGSFELSGLPEGSVKLLFHRLGYATLTREVVLPAQGALEVSLQETPFTLPAFEVTAARTPRPLLDSPLPSAFLGQATLARESSISLAHALEKLSGVRTVSTGAQIGKPMVRGLTGSRVLVLSNGHRVEDYSWSDEDGPSVDPALVGRVEVIRGPASLLYGSDAISGVVNAIAPELPRAERKESFVRGKLGGYFSSNSRGGGGWLRLEGARGNLGWRVAGTGRFAEALHTPDGELENTGFGAVTGDAAALIRGEDRELSLQISHYGGEFKLLEAGGPPPGVQEGEEEGPERKSSDWRVQLDGKRQLGALHLETKAQWERHSLIELSDEALADSTAIAPATSSGGKEQEAFHLLLDSFSLDLLAHHRIGGKLNGTVGVSGLLQFNDTQGPIPLVPDASTSSAGAFVFEEARLGRWSVLGGARADVRKLKADANPGLALVADDERDWSAFSSDMGAVFRPQRHLALSVNAGLAWRAPTLFELYADGPQIAEARYLRGRADLKAEHALDLDAGVRYETERVRAELSVYRNRIDDFVALSPTAGMIDGLRLWEYGRTDAILSGMEAGLSGPVGGPFRLSGRFDTVRGEVRGSGDPLPLIPPPRGVLGAEAAWQELSWAEQFQVGVEIELVSRKHRLASEEFSTAGYVLVACGAQLNRVLMGREWEVSLRMDNLLDKRYRDFLSRYKEFADNPGRDVRLKVATSF